MSSFFLCPFLRYTEITYMMKTLRMWLIFTILALTWGQACSQGQLYAVIVGVSKYRQAENNLQCSAIDAQEMYGLLKKHAPETNLQLLTDERATADNVLSAVNKMFTKTSESDIVLFYFSGHGDTGYYYAHDGRLLHSQLQAVFKNTKAKRKLVFADACMSGSMRKPGKTHTSRQSNRFNDNVLLFLSSRSDQMSREIISLKNSVFTYFLMAGLRGGADANHDRIITAKELFDFVSPKVKERTNGGQAPVMWGKFDDNMIILNWK